jgi:hypothetical protein
MDVKSKQRKCLYCYAEFRVTKPWQLYCQNSCKVRHWKEARNYCFFCGDWRPSDRHHLYPVALRGGPRIYANQETIWVCKTCNTELSDRNFESVDDQFCWLLTFYNGLKAHKMPLWQDVEIQELGPRLKHTVKKALAKYRQIEEKIGYLTIHRAMIARNEIE